MASDPSEIQQIQLDLVRFSACVLASATTLRPSLRSLSGCFKFPRFATLARLFTANNIIHCVLFAGTAVYTDFFPGDSTADFFNVAFRPFNLILRVVWCLVFAARTDTMLLLQGFTYHQVALYVVVATQVALYTSGSGIQIAAIYTDVSEQSASAAANLIYAADVILAVYLICQQIIFIVAYTKFLKQDNQETGDGRTSWGNVRRELFGANNGKADREAKESSFRSWMFIVETVLLFTTLICTILSRDAAFCDSIADMRYLALSLCCADAFDLSDEFNDPTATGARQSSKGATAVGKSSRSRTPKGTKCSALEAA